MPDRGAAPEPCAAHGIFETLRTYRGEPFALDDHVERLWASARTLGLAMPATRRAVIQRLQRLARRGQGRDRLLRVAVLPAHPQARLVYLSRPLPRHPASWYTGGIDLWTVPSARLTVAAVNPQVKHSNRLALILAQLDLPAPLPQARQAGRPARQTGQVLRCDRHGYVVEGTTANLFIVAREALQTPALWQGALDGVTRRRLLRLAAALRLPVEERPLTRHDVYNAQEGFLTNTSMELLPVRRLDGRTLGTRCPGPVTSRLRQAWREMVEGITHG